MNAKKEKSSLGFPFLHNYVHTQVRISVSLPLANVSYQISLKAFSLHLRSDVKQTTKSSEHLTVCEMNK